MRFFKNRFFIIALAAALLITVSATVLAVMGIGSPLRSLFGTITMPFRWCATKLAEGMNGYTVYFRKIDSFVEENNALREENAVLREKLAEAERQAHEDEYLREYLGLDWLENKWKLTDATLIGRESGSYRTVYTFNKGSLHGIKKGMPVTTAQGVVGYVSETGLAWCKVMSLLETTSSVGVYDRRSGAAGLLTGDMKLRVDGLCLMTYIDADADIKPGDLIITAGTGSIYPAGLTVGEVVSVEPDEYSRTLTATVRPAADFGGLSTAMIITSYEIIPFGPEDTVPEADGTGAVTEATP